MKVQVAAHGAARRQLGGPQLGTGQVDEVHALGHHQQMLLRIGLAAQRVQDVGDMLRRAKVDLAFHAQQFELRALGQGLMRRLTRINRVARRINHHELPALPPAVKAHAAHRRP